MQSFFFYKPFIVISSIAAVFVLSSCNTGNKGTIKPLSKKPIIDSSLIQKNDLIKKYNCDTTNLFDFDTYTAKKNQILRDYKKNRLIRVLLSDIYSDNDSSNILSGTSLDHHFIGYKCYLKLESNCVLNDVQRFKLVYCVIKDIKIKPMDNINEASSEDQNLERDDLTKYHLIANCLWFERDVLK